MPTSDHAPARQHARAIATLVTRQLEQRSPASELATVADTSQLTEFGYLSATAARGPVQVIGVPPEDYHKLLPGTRMYIRRMRVGGMQAALFDGYAPTSKALTATGGALAVSHAASPVAAAASALSWTSSTVAGGTPLTTLPSGPTGGWFWSFACNLSRVPDLGQSYVLVDMAHITSGTTIAGGMQITYDWLGRLNIAYYGTWTGAPGSSTPMATALAPGRDWWLTLQLGQTSGLVDLDGATFSDGNHQISATISGVSVPAGTYALWLLGDHANSQVCAPGSWISKYVFGCDAISGTALWPYPVTPNPVTIDSSLFTPQSDGDVANDLATINTGLTVYNRYLMSDWVAGSPSTLPDTALGNSSPMALSLTPSAQVLTSGPY
jgi:hypothetical protein